LGTVRDLVQYNTTTSTTTLVNHIQYDTFGQLTSQTNTSQTPWFGYTGREWDTATGLTYYRARWYDPRAGRFISEDPLSFAAGDVNLNRYVGNGATLWVDPSGMAGQPSRDDMATAMMAPLAWAQANNAVPKGDKHCGNLVFEQVFAHQGWLDSMRGVSPDVLGMVAYDGSDDNARDMAREIARLMKLKRGLAEIRESVQKGVVAANVLVQIGNEPLDIILSTHEAITNPSWRTIGGALASTLPLVPGIAGKADDVVDLGKAEDMAKREAAAIGPKTVLVDATKSPESAKHLVDSGAVGKPLTVNRAAGAKNRREALKGTPKVPGHDLDESPPAVLRQPGDPVSLRPIVPGDNRSAGAQIGNQLTGVSNGQQVIIEIINGTK
jgi:RHS repeat-associated protein